MQKRHSYKYQIGDKYVMALNSVIYRINNIIVGKNI